MNFVSIGNLLLLLFMHMEEAENLARLIEHRERSIEDTKKYIVFLKEEIRLKKDEVKIARKRKEEIEQADDLKNKIKRKYKDFLSQDPTAPDTHDCTDSGGWNLPRLVRHYANYDEGCPEKRHDHCTVCKQIVV